MWLFSALPFRVLYNAFGFKLSADVSCWKISSESSSGKSIEIISGKTDAERLQIERKFYRYLSDYMLEDLKLLHMSAEELL